MLKTVLNLLVFCLLIGCSGSGRTSPEEERSSSLDGSPPVSAADDVGHNGSSEAFLPVKLNSQYLPNSVQLHPKVISGGLPEGDAAFQELADLGVKTVISVDGMTPDVAMAARHGLRYVHLPHGYDGIPEQRIKELARAVRDLPGPIYIHCHHGKHRSPTAASVACVGAGLISGELAVPILKLAGTDPGYRGLFEAAEQATSFEDSFLNELQVEFKEVQEIPPMAEAMVDVSHISDHLKQIAEAGWISPSSHPDLKPAHQLLLLRELFTEMLRTEEVKEQPDDFQELLRDSEAATRTLETELGEWKSLQQSSPSPTSPPSVLTGHLDRILANCKACHSQYRDVPLNEKKVHTRMVDDQK
ncbi:MAG: hypothetical protein R3C20_08890 [Planctomycetaceae bacterium]